MVKMAEKSGEPNEPNELNERQDYKEMKIKTEYLETPQENLTIFACLIDMIALEEGVFGSGTSSSRIARAHRNLKRGLQLKDGTIFRYSHSIGPSLHESDETAAENIKQEQIEKR